MAKYIPQIGKINYFCSATIRPDCLKGLSSNLCCLYCDSVEKCIEQNKSKIKPCSPNIIGMDDFCEFSI